MAIMDNFAIFSGAVSAAGVVSGQTVTGTNTSIVSTNSYDTQGGSPSAQNVDLGKGERLDVVFQVLTAFVGLTSLELQYVSADDAALTTNVTVLDSSGAIPLANLTLGAQSVLQLNPTEPRTLRRYVGTRYVIVGTGTAGAIFASLQHRHGELPMPAYKSGFAIS